MHSLTRRNFLRQTGYAGSAVTAFGLLPSKVLSADDVNLLTADPNVVDLPAPSAEVHVLNRTSFGIRSEDLETIEQIGIDAYVEQQLDPDSIDDSELDAILKEKFPTLFLSGIELKALLDSDEKTQGQIAAELKAATFYRAVRSKRQLFEVMTEFWSNHFNVFHFDGPIALLKTLEDRNVIRAYAMGSFTDLLHASTKSPAMIYYLDTYASTKESPNENYARELMELHTLGVDGPYTHDDIDEIARCFTGWTIGQRNNLGEFVFRPANHDNDSKTVLGSFIPAGGGVKDGEQVVEILAGHESTAYYLASKLIRRFVADEPSEELTQKVADVFVSSNGDIKETLRSVLYSEEFAQSFDQKLKRPFCYMTSVFRSLDINPGTGSARQIGEVLNAMGQAPFNWQPPDGYPDNANYWASTTGLLTRWNFAISVANNNIRDVNFNLLSLLEKPYTAENIVDVLAANICHRELLNEDRDALIAHIKNVSSVSVKEVVIKVRGVLALLMSSPYFLWR